MFHECIIVVDHDYIHRMLISVNGCRLIYRCKRACDMARFINRHRAMYRLRGEPEREAAREAGHGPIL